jgi:hypothetical protein
MTSTFDGWGYVHLYRNRPALPQQAGKLVESDTYAIPEAHDRAYGIGFGDLSVHEAATSLRDSRLGGKLTEVGRFIDTGGNNF